ncbi:MAG TPA: DUF6454 family protein [Bryobacteraceae bacterium]|nr:DUF6454 family protein [Bryobacteraceae bacterium]
MIRLRAVPLIFLSAFIAAAQPADTSLDSAKLTRVIELKGATYHVQGVYPEGDRVWVTSVDRESRRGFLFQFSMKTGELVKTTEIHDGERFHPGGLDARDKSLWIPVAEYRANSSAVIQRRNKDTHALEFQFAVPDHIGCIAVTPEFVIGGNWDSRIFYFWTHAGEMVRKVDSTTGNAYQDMKFDGGYVVAGGVLADRSGAVDWLDLKSMSLVHRMKVGRTDRGAPFTREGTSIRGNEIVFLPEDSPSRLFLFKLGR